nr:glycogen synthase GlgA [Maliibacterium massiliense]
MRILHVASEAEPFIKTGGLADVLGALPRQQARMGNEVAVMLPKYHDIPQMYRDQMQHVMDFTVQLGWRTQYCGVEMLRYEDVTYYFIDNEFYFGSPGVYTSGEFEAERFSFFCRGVLEAMGRMGYYPNVLHCHDWQSGMVPFMLRSQYSFNPAYAAIRCVFTIHNLRYQGVFNWPMLEGMLFIDPRYRNPNDLEFHTGCSFMKGGIVFSDIVTTVSPTYAQEIQGTFFGEKLEGLLCARSDRLFGVLNGIDTEAYDPARDSLIPQQYSRSDKSGKAVCKRALQHELGLAVRPEVPIVAMITRLTDQKGLDLLENVLRELLNDDLQLVVLGSGEQKYVDMLGWASHAYPGKVACRIEMNNPLAHRIYAGADMFLMPSLFEPCGLSQMIAMRYGTLPIVRETGGLRDTVQPYNEFENTGNGFSFGAYNAPDMLYTIRRAERFFYNDKQAWEGLMDRAMAGDYTWERSAARYLELYRQA